MTPKASVASLTLALVALAPFQVLPAVAAGTGVGIVAQLSPNTRQSPLTIDWSNVITSQPRTNWKRDLTTCACDATLGRCDANCCCDTDCTTDQSLYFTACVESASGVGSTTIPFCSQYLSSVNWQSQTGATVYKSSGGALCVVFANSAVQGDFFDDPGSFTQESSFNVQYAAAVFSPDLTVYNVDTSYLSKSAYRFGSPIQVYYSGASAYGYLTLPSASSGSLCDTTATAKFMQSTAGSCQRVISSVAAACAPASVFHLSYYVNGFQLVSDPATSSSISVTLNQVKCVSATTGLATTCASASTVPSLSGAVCSQMVSKITYTLVYSLTSGTPIVTSVLVDAVLTSATLAVGDTIVQSFETKFVPSATSETFTRSGSPGYAVGSPILAGTLSVQGTTSAISYIPDPLLGITLPIDVAVAGSPSSVQCPAETSYTGRSPISFGENGVYGCTLKLNRASLLTSAGCATIRTRVYALQTLTAASITHVGIFGNASVNNVYDWVKVINSPPADVTGTQAITDTAGTCSSILTEFGIQVLYTYVGSRTNPQRAIVGMRFSYTAGKFEWRCLSQTDCVNPTTAHGAPAASAGVGINPQNFRIRSTVSFVQVPNVGTSLFSPPAPRLMAQVADDLWYPFRIV
ncbi:hypothetical protein BC831DRAFT_468969 [Entophlyctis helioformis]|nr:hypothetical protein BC831DRAFT_468969 [Entophlyctis helioformis]